MNKQILKKKKFNPPYHGSGILITKSRIGWLHSTLLMLHLSRLEMNQLTLKKKKKVHPCAIASTYILTRALSSWGNTHKANVDKKFNHSFLVVECGVHLSFCLHSYSDLLEGLQTDDIVANPMPIDMCIFRKEKSSKRHVLFKGWGGGGQNSKFLEFENSFPQISMNWGFTKSQILAVWWKVCGFCLRTKCNRWKKPQQVNHCFFTFSFGFKQIMQIRVKEATTIDL